LFKKFLYKWLLPKLIKRKCEERIPRSGDEGEKVNCFSIALDSQDSPFFRLIDFRNDKLIGLQWNGNRYEDELSINLSDIDKYDFKVTHYYGLNEVYYDGIYSIAWNYLTRQIYFKIKFYRALSSISQYFFNKKRLITKRRMELLQLMLNIYLDNEQSNIDTIDLMTKLYSIRWVSHPSGDQQMRKLKIYLESLVDSGEIIKENQGYRVTGKAITTLENFEKEEQRHISNVKLQRRLVWLTLILVLIGLIQSGIVKLPTILDFRSNTKNTIIKNIGR
jgi:hypothetical protein